MAKALFARLQLIERIEPPFETQQSVLSEKQVCETPMAQQDRFILVSASVVKPSKNVTLAIPVEPFDM